MRIARGVSVPLLFSPAACTLLAPSDRDLMGAVFDAGESPTDGALPNAGDVTAPDGSASAPDGAANDGAGGGANDAGVDAGDPASCAACKQMSVACVAAPDCNCVRSEVCNDAATCIQVGDQLTVKCGATSCTSSGPGGALFCTVEAGFCSCK